MNYIADPAPRSGMRAWLGKLRARATRADYSAVESSFWVPQPEAMECDFWLCTLRDQADNGDNFFGPVELA